MTQSIYKKVLLELEKETSVMQKYNKLLSYRADTEDSVLVQLIGSCLLCYLLMNFYLSMDYCKYKKFISEFEKLESDLNVHEHNLVEYCNEMVDSLKPEWQILAERNGWKKVEGEVSGSSTNTSCMEDYIGSASKLLKSRLNDLYKSFCDSIDWEDLAREIIQGNNL